LLFVLFYYVYQYEIIATNSDLELYRKKLIEYYNNEKEFEEKEFEEFIIEELARCASINNEINIKRTYHIFLSKKFLTLSLIISSITFIIHLLNYIL